MPDQFNAGPAISDSVVGLIDIGSNSIRLVIYRAGGRLPHPQFNEREVCRLGEDLNKTGLIAEDRIDHALRTLARFARIIDASSLDRIDVFATEALRKTANADDFIASAEDILPVKIRILSGEEEAKFSGKGVVSGFVNVDGVVGDLGGGSLELAHVHSEGAKQRNFLTSLSLGHLLKLTENEIVLRLKTADWLSEMHDRSFYAVGGTWRAMATAYTYASKKRVDIVHGLTLSSDVVHKLLAEVSACNGEMEGIPPARRSSMTQAVKVMSCLLSELRPSAIIFSSYGVREGILYDDLSRDVRVMDPLMAGVQEYGAMTERFAGLGLALSEQIKQLIKNLPSHHQRLAQACCYLADISWLDHPDYRANLAIEKMLGLSVVGIDHTDRAWMAAALSVRYLGSFPSRKLLRGMLSRKDRKSARFVGLTLRMLMSISGGIPNLITALKITSEKKSAKIGIPQNLAGVEKGLVMRRIGALSPYTTLKITSYYI